MKPSPAPTTNYRWLAGLLVAVAVVGILGFKIFGTRMPSSSLPSADVHAGVTMSALNTTTSATPMPQQSAPFPQSPSAQVEWVLRNKRSAMVLFHSTMCRPCRMMDALVQMVRRDYEPTVVFIDVVIDNPSNAELVRQAQIRSIPTSFFINRSGQGKRIIGLMSQQDLRAELANLMAEE